MRKTLASITLLSHCALALAQEWTARPDFIGTGRDDAASFAIGTSVYVGTGRQVGFGLTSDWFRFDTPTNTWSTVASLPAAGRQYCVAFTLDEQGYLFGGAADAGRLDELWAYDPNTDAWEEKASLPAAGRSGSAVFVINGYAYVVGGRLGSGDNMTSEVWRYDADADSWTARTDVPGTPRSLCAAFAIAAHGYVVTGQDWAGAALSEGWSYDPDDNAWSPITPFPDARYGGEGFTIDDRGLVLAGESAPNGYPMYAGYYDADDDEWTEGPHMTTVARKGGTGASVGNKAYYGTGIAVDVRLTDWYELDGDVGITERSDDFSPALFPVPANDFINLRGVDPSVVAHADIHDLHGRLVMTLTQPQLDRKIPLVELVAGSYVLTIRTPTRTISLPFVHLP